MTQKKRGGMESAAVVPSPPEPVSRAAWGRRARVLALIVAGAGMISGAAGWWFYRASGDATTGPVIVISIDTLRADHLPAYGYTNVATPAFDTLARDGVVFERAYAHAPQTLPSHASILSGRLPFEHGVRDNVGFTVNAGERLLPAMLGDRGFATAGIVSSYVLRKETGIGQGFDHFDSDLPAASPESSIGQIQRSGLESLAAARRWLSTHSDPKFFLFFHVFEPHKPYAPPDRFAHFGPYDGEVATADEAVGGLLQTLRERGLYDRAAIILLADHGEGLGDHGEEEHGLFLYNETIRVPLIVKLPGSRHGGRRLATTVQLIDLVPTVLDLVGADAPRGLRGRSLRPLLEDQTSTLPDTGVYSEAMYSRFHFGWSELHALTDQRYRYIRAPKEELYDLEQDAGERHNLSTTRAQTRAAMRAAVDRLLAGSSLEAPGQVAEEDRERLAALGYVGRGGDVAVNTAADSLPDPKDKVQVLETYRRAAALAGERRYFEAIPLYRQILDEDPGMSDVWLQLAQVSARSGQDAAAADAFKKAIALSPGDSGAIIALGDVLLRLGRFDEAAAHAGLAVKAAPAAAHELLARIALARRDPASAEREAALATEADPTLPLPLYVKGLLRYREGRYADALPLFEEAIARLRTRTVQMSEIHYYAGDTLARLERYPEAERELKQEVALFPHNIRARASLAMVYVATGREADAEQAVASILQSAPSPEGYALAAELWTLFGVPERAQALVAEATRRFGPNWKPKTGSRTDPVS